MVDADRATARGPGSSQLRDLGVGGLGVGVGGSDYYLAEAVAVPDASCVHQHEPDGQESSPEAAMAGGGEDDVGGGGGGGGGSGVGDDGVMIPDSVVRAESMAHKLVWTKRRAVLSAVAVVLLVIVVVLAVVLPLTSSRSSAASSSSSSLRRNHPNPTWK